MCLEFCLNTKLFAQSQSVFYPHAFDECVPFHTLLNPMLYRKCTTHNLCLQAAVAPMQSARWCLGLIAPQPPLKASECLDPCMRSTVNLQSGSKRFTVNALLPSSALSPADRALCPRSQDATEHMNVSLARMRSARRGDRIMVCQQAEIKVYVFTGGVFMS